MIRARRLLGRAIARRRRAWLVDRGVRCEGEVHFHGRPVVLLAPGSHVTLGDGVVLAGRHEANSLDARGPCVLRTTAPGAVLAIGAHVGLTAVTLSASYDITIGDRCLLGAGVVITDSDHHVVDLAQVDHRRHAGPPKPTARDKVVLESDVFIGARSIILKGVTIGEGSVVGAGSVVTRDVPPRVVAGGNPAGVIRQLRGG